MVVSGKEKGDLCCIKGGKGEREGEKGIERGARERKNITFGL